MTPTPIPTPLPLLDDMLPAVQSHMGAATAITLHPGGLLILAALFLFLAFQVVSMVRQ